jgi:hypothetical protein
VSKMEYPSTIEFFQVTDKTPWSSMYRLATVVIDGLTLTLEHHSAGYTVAGSAAIWRKESWRVGRLFRGTASGQYFDNPASARYDFTHRCMNAEGGEVNNTTRTGPDGCFAALS